MPLGAIYIHVKWTSGQHINSYQHNYLEKNVEKKNRERLMTTRHSNDAASFLVHRTRTNRRILPLLLASAALAASTSTTLHATTVTSTWIGATSTNWSAASNWSPNSAFPNNGNAGVSDYNVIINAVTNPDFAPTLDTAATIDALTLNTGATLSIAAGISLNTTAATLTNSGNITITGNNTLGSATLNSSPGPISLTGNGTIFLTNTAFSHIAGGTWTNLNNTISGTGTITASGLINQGTISPAGGNLTINPSITNTGGLIDIAADGTLIESGTVTGGTLHTLAASSVTGNFSNVTSTGCLSIRTLGPFTIQNTFTNQSTVTVLGDSTNGLAQFNGSGNVTLTGGGNVVLTNANFSHIGGGNWTNVNNIISGCGSITATGFINQGTIEPAGGNLTINPSVDNTAGSIIVAADGTLIENATITGGILNTQPASNVTGTFNNITSTGCLSIRPIGIFNAQGTFTNSGNVTIFGDPVNGQAQFNASGNVSLTGNGTIFLTNATFSHIGGTGNWTNVNNTIRGQGTVTASLINQHTIIAEGGNLTFNTSLDNTAGSVIVAADGTLNVGANLVGGTLNTQSASTVIGTLKDVTSTGCLTVRTTGVINFLDAFTNSGNVTVLGDNVNGAAQFNASGNVSLTGGGTVFLTNATFSHIGGTGNWTNVDNTIRGQGTITSPLINQHAFIAEGGAITLNTTFDNSAGTFTVASDGALNAASALSGGTLFSQAASTVFGTLSNLTISGTVTVRTTNTLTLSGNINNQGTINILGDSTNGAAQLIANTPVTLTGGGSVILTNATFSHFTGSSSINNIDNTISGTGIINPAAFQSSGPIVVSGGPLTINAPVTLNGAPVSGNNSLLINDPLTVNGNTSFAADVRSGPLTLAGTTGAWTAHLDVTNTRLNIEDSTVNRSADVANIKNAAVYGLTHATGISSSTIPSNKVLAVSDNAIAHDTTFEGLTNIDTNSILVTVAFKGDANLDGVVDILDLTTVANHWQQSVTDWSQGDFDHSNFVDIQDLTAVANNWQAGVGGGGSSFSDALAQFPAFAGTAPAPEPASLILIGLGSAMLLRRRSKNKR